MKNARQKMSSSQSLVVVPEGKVPTWDLPIHVIGGIRYVAMTEIWNLDPEEHRLSEAYWNGVPFSRDVRREDSFVGVVSLMLAEFSSKRAKVLRETWVEIGATDKTHLLYWWLDCNHGFSGEIRSCINAASYTTPSLRRVQWYTGTLTENADENQRLWVQFGPEGSYNLLCKLIEVLGLPEELLTDAPGD